METISTSLDYRPTEGKALTIRYDLNREFEEGFKLTSIEDLETGIPIDPTQEEIEYAERLIFHAEFTLENELPSW